jgi:hypothetical protein
VKRICLAGAAIAGLLTIGVSTAPASTTHAAVRATAGKKKTTKPATVTTKVTCSLSLSDQVPSGSVTVTQGAVQGSQYGKANCGTALGSGLQVDSFASDSGGTVSGTYQQYFKAGTVYGAYTLATNDTGPPTTTSFTSASFTGTITIKNGTGIDKKAVGTGTLTCLTTDSIHYACTEKLKLTLPAPVTTTTTK